MGLRPSYKMSDYAIANPTYRFLLENNCMEKVPYKNEN